MFKKKWVRIVVIMLAAALVVASVTAIADASRAGNSVAARDFDGFKVFVKDWGVMLSSVSTDYFQAKVDDSMVGEFMDSLRGMKLHGVSEEQRQELIDSGYLAKYSDMYAISVYDSNNKLALKLTALRNSTTGEWSRVFTVTVEENGESDVRLLMAPEESFDGAAIERVMDDAFGGDLDKYVEYFNECQANPEMRFDFEGLSENFPGMDYQTYEDMKDQLSDDTPVDLPSFICAEVN